MAIDKILLMHRSTMPWVYAETVIANKTRTRQQLQISLWSLLACWSFLRASNNRNIELTPLKLASLHSAPFLSPPLALVEGRQSDEGVAETQSSKTCSDLIDSASVAGLVMCFWRSQGLQ